MALRALMLGKKLSDKNKELEAMREKLNGFTQREAELEKAIQEAETEEERTAVEESIEKFENEKADTEDADGDEQLHGQYPPPFAFSQIYQRTP